MRYTTDTIWKNDAETPVNVFPALPTSSTEDQTGYLIQKSMWNRECSGSGKQSFLIFHKTVSVKS